MAKSGVCVAYLAGDSERGARRLYNTFVKLLGDRLVLKPVEITASAPATLETCRTVFVLVTPRWRKAFAKRRRKPQPEISADAFLCAALADPDIQVAPVLFGAAGTPAREDLPAPLRALSVLAPVRLRTGAKLKADCAALADAVRAAQTNGFFNVPESLRPPPPRGRRSGGAGLVLRILAAAACLAGAVLVEWRFPLF